MNFHFPIMPRIFMSIHMEDRFPLVDILAQTPPIAENCQWALFLRNHDELTLEMVTDEERDYMYKAYANEQTMRINLGIRRRLAPLVENDRRKMELMNAMLFSLPGTPVIYYGDEIGMGDNVYLGDRNGVRTPMQWSADRNAGFSRANPQRLILPIIIDPEYHYESIHVEAQQGNPNSLLWWMKRTLALRKKYKAFGRGTMELLSPDNPKIFAFVRSFENESILVVTNLSRLMQYAELDLSKWKGLRPIELSGHTELPIIGDAPYLITLGGHAFYWFSLERPSTAEQDEREAAYQPPVIEVMGAWPSVLRGDDAAALEAALPAYLAGRRWFGGRDRAINAVTILDSLPVGDDPTGMHIVIVRVEYAEGDPERYVLPLAFASEERSVELRARAPLAVLATVRAHPSGGAVNGVLFDAVAEGPCCRSLLQAMLERRRAKGAAGELVAGTERELDTSGPIEPKVISAAHESAAIVYGDKFILKLFRRMDEGMSPDLEIGRFLAKYTSYSGVAPLMGSMEYVTAREEPVTIATLLGFVPNEVTAWQFTREEVSRFFTRVLARSRDEAAPARPSGPLLDLVDQTPPPDVIGMIGTYLDLAKLLGRRTGELHMALASDAGDPAFAPEPISALYQRSKYQSMRNLTGRVVRQLRTRLSKLPASVRPMAEGLLAREDKLLKRFEGLLKAKLTGARIRCHGNLHLGQVLYTGKDFVIIDFEGDRDKPISERRRKRLSLRDVAGMLRSFHYAAFTALIDDTVVRPEDRPLAEPWAHVWALWVSAAYLGAYFQATKGAEFLPKTREELAIVLDSAVMEKALSELGHELRSKSAWVSVPLQGIAEALDADTAK
jgi:maltose alpha-D-glucosyltransferase/alpha-amylase